MSIWNKRNAFAVLAVGAMSSVGVMGCSSDDSSGGTNGADSGTGTGTGVDSGTGTGTGSDSGSSADTGAAALGPGAALKCDSSGKDAFDTYGAPAFVAVNESIVSNVFAELKANSTANLGDSFGKLGSGNPPSTADDAATFKGKLAAFLVYAYGGPSSITYTDNKTYTGPQDMVAAHTGLAITSAQYDYFVTMIVVPALTSNGVKAGKGGATDPNDVSSCFAPILLDASFKASIVGH